MKSREARYIYLLTALLIARTLMSIWLADVNGKVVKAIVNKSFPEFLRRVSLPDPPPLSALFSSHTSNQLAISMVLRVLLPL